MACWVYLYWGVGASHNLVLETSESEIQWAAKCSIAISCHCDAQSWQYFIKGTKREESFVFAVMLSPVQALTPPVPSLFHSLSDGFSVQSVQGMLYKPVSGAWSWTNSTAINYALHAVKLRDSPQPDQAEESGPQPENHAAAKHSWATGQDIKSEIK